MLVSPYMCIESMSLFYNIPVATISRRRRMTTGWSLRDDSITLSPQEYTHASGIYKKCIFSPNDYASLLWEQGAWYPVYLYTRKPACNALLLHRLLGGICLFTTSYLYWWWSLSLNLESWMKLIKISCSYLLRAKSSGDGNLWTKLKMV